MLCTWVRLYTRIHHGLCVARLVAFVVTKPAKTNKVEHDVRVVLMTIGESDLHNAISRLRVVSIYMEYRRLGDLCRVGRIDGRTSQFRGRGKAYLIVDHYMDRAARPVARKIGELERFHHDP